MRREIQHAAGVLCLVSLACGGASVRTHATEADQLGSAGEPLKAVVSYDYALEHDIPKDHPEYKATKDKRLRALLDYADKEARDSEQDALDDRFTRLRTTLNTLRKLDSDIQVDRATAFVAAFDTVLKTLADKALGLANPGERFRRLEFLAASGPKGNAAQAVLDGERKTQLAHYDELIKQSGPALSFLYSATAKRILPSRELLERPSTELALRPEAHRGACLADLKGAELTSEGPFAIGYSLEGLACKPESKGYTKEASYSYIEHVPKTVTRRVSAGERCTPTTVVRQHNVCMKFSSNNSGCTQWGVQTVQEAGIPKCSTEYVDKQVTIMEPVERTGTRTESHVEHRYAIDFKVRFSVGSKWVTQTHSVDEVLSDYAYETVHGSRSISLVAGNAQRAAWDALRGKILKAQEAARAELGNQRFAAASNDEERAIATLLGAEAGVAWVSDAAGFAMEDLPRLAKNETIAVQLPSATAEMPSLESDIRRTSSLGLKYADAWKGGTNVYLTEGGGLRASNEATTLGEKGALALRYERRSGLDDFRFSYMASLHMDLENPTDNLGWGIGQYTLFGDYEAATAIVYTMGVRYEQRKSGGELAFRALSLDYAVYFPITRYVSLDAGIELNTAKLFGKSETIDYGSDIWGGVSVYLGKSLSAALRYSKWFASDFDTTATASVTLWH